MAVNSSHKAELSVAVLGDVGVGKTTFIRQFTGTADEDYYASMNPYSGEIEVDGKAWDIRFLEGEGGPDGHSETVRVLRSARAVLILYALNDPQSLERVEDFIGTVMKVNDWADTYEFAIVLVGNKSDLPVEHLTVTQPDVTAVATKLGIPFVEVSAAESRTSVLAAVTTLLQLETKLRTPTPKTNAETRDNGKCSIS